MLITNINQDTNAGNLSQYSVILLDLLLIYKTKPI